MTAHLLFIAATLAIITMGSLRRRPRGGAERRSHSLNYEIYLRSPLWRVRRRLWILSTFGRCEACGRRRGPLTIHHRTYRRLGYERRRDVKVLCWRCHSARHARGRV